MTIIVLTEKAKQIEWICDGLGFAGRGGNYNGRDYALVNASGHLLERDSPDNVIANASWSDPSTLLPLPRDIPLVPLKDRRDKLDNIKKALKHATHVILATDPDREGEAIGRNLLQYFGYNGKVERLWLAHGTDPVSIQEAFAKLRAEPDTRGMYHAQQARDLLDWLYMLITRAHTAYGRRGGMGQHLGQGKGRESVVSVGRVQSPTLRLVVDRDRARAKFKPTTHYKAKLHVSQDGGPSIALPYFPVVSDDDLGANLPGIEWQQPKNPEKDKPKPMFVDPDAAQAFADRLTGLGQVTIAVQTKAGTKRAPLCYSLDDIQAKASTLFNLSIAKTLEIAQSLYQDGYISYPRTKDQELPLAAYEKAPAILGMLASYGLQPAADAAERHAHAAGQAPARDDAAARPRVYSKRERAHDGLSPTTKQPSNLPAEQKRVYDLIAKRFIEAHLPDAVTEIMGIQAKPDVEGMINDEPCRFAHRGERIVEAGWMAAFRDHDESKFEALPDLSNGAADVVKADFDTAKTKAPPIFTEATLLAAMVNAGNELTGADAKILKKVEGIGTPATRANILTTLYDRGYLAKTKKSQVTATPKGCDLVDYADEQISSIALTAHWETILSEVDMATGDGGLADRDRFVDEQVQMLTGVMEDLISRLSELPARAGGGCGSNGPTPKMAALAAKIRAHLDVEPEGDISASFDACKVFINAHIDDYKASAPKASNPPTPKMKKLAEDLAGRRNEKMPKAAADTFDGCKAYIDKHMNNTARPPSDKMVGFAEKLARENSVELPKGLKTDYKVCKGFLDTHAKRKAS